MRRRRDSAETAHTRSNRGCIFFTARRRRRIRRPNADEADDASSDRDFRAKERICLREIKEARLRIRVLRRTGFLGMEHDSLIQEADELRRIVSTIIRNNARNNVKQSERP